MINLDVGAVAASLSRDFGVELVTGDLSLDGGTWPVIRPALPPEPNGFSILLGTSPRRAIATFQPDRFSRELLSTMSVAEPDLRAAAVAHAEAMEAQGARFLCRLDGIAVVAASELMGRWSRLDFEFEIPISANGGMRPQQAITTAAGAALGLALSLVSLEEQPANLEPGLPEGARLQVFVNRYERSPVNRARCLSHFGYSCQACGFDFARAYGEAGAGFIEVHHVKMVSQMGEGYLVDPIKDLIPLCANCHAIAHRRTPPYTVTELRAMTASAGSHE